MGVVELERRGPAAWLWLNRPEARNALNDAVLDSLSEFLNHLEKNSETRVVVLAGRGQAFCAGGDIARMEQAARLAPAKSRRAAARAAKFFHRIHTYPKPVIARVHGAAFAGEIGRAHV